MTPNQQVIAGRCFRVHQMAVGANNSIIHSKLTFNARFYVGLLRRQAIILHDAAMLIKDRRPEHLMPVFILFRCLLDDFILLLHLHNSGFNGEEIVKHTASAFDERFKIVDWSRQINNRFFAGNDTELATNEEYKEQWDEFVSDEENHRFFTDIKKGKFKKFEKTTAIVERLLKNDKFAEVNSSNLNAFVDWKIQSFYVHFSTITERFEKGNESRDIEVRKLNEALTYCYKSLLIIGAGLKKEGIVCEVNDRTTVWNELIGGLPI